MQPRVLVIEDDPSIVELYQTILTEEGWAVDIGDYTEIVHGRVAVGTPDVILLDWMLGKEPGGCIIVRRLKDNPVTQGIPIVVCTAAAHRMAEIEPKLTALGIPIVTKPFEVDAFLTVLRTAAHTGAQATADSFGSTVRPLEMSIRDRTKSP
jgi:DNA-binding response OmpR family regulator